MDVNQDVKRGCEHPYDATDDQAYEGGDPARMATLGILKNLCGRSGIKHALHGIDDDVRAEIVDSLTEIVRAAFDLAGEGEEAEVAGSTPSSGNVFRDLGFENPEAELAAADARIAAHQVESEARFIAGLAADILPHSVDGKAVYPGTPEADRAQVRRAMALLAESRRQVSSNRNSGGRFAPSLAIEFHQKDFVPGFAAFLPGATTPAPDSRAFCILNIGSLLAGVHMGDVAAAEIPYAVAETMMHEIMHVLEQWAGVEFSEERIEALIERYRASVQQDAGEVAAERGSA